MTPSNQVANHASTIETITVNANTAMAKMGVAGGGTALGMSGLDWSQVAAFLTCIFVFLQIILIIPKFVQLVKAVFKGRKVKVEVTR